MLLISACVSGIEDRAQDRFQSRDAGSEHLEDSVPVHLRRLGGELLRRAQGRHSRRLCHDRTIRSAGSRGTRTRFPRSAEGFRRCPVRVARPAAFFRLETWQQRKSERNSRKSPSTLPVAPGSLLLAKRSDSGNARPGARKIPIPMEKLRGFRSRTRRGSSDTSRFRTNNP